jgi:hypothetical protein
VIWFKRIKINRYHTKDASLNTIKRVTTIL